jgi:hypothetical protein
MRPLLEAHINWAKEVKTQLAAKNSDKGEPAVSLSNSDVEDNLLDSIRYFSKDGS